MQSRVCCRAVSRLIVRSPSFSALLLFLTPCPSFLPSNFYAVIVGFLKPHQPLSKPPPFDSHLLKPVGIRGQFQESWSGKVYLGMPSKIQLDVNLWFLYLCLQNSDYKTVSLLLSSNVSNDLNLHSLDVSQFPSIPCFVRLWC